MLFLHFARADWLELRANRRMGRLDFAEDIRTSIWTPEQVVPISFG
jgi:hypothetical protein